MSSSTELFFGPFCLRGRGGPLLMGDEEIKLQPRTLALLWTLVSRPGEVVAKSVLMDAIWPQQSVGEDALSFQTQALRRALLDDPRAPRYILTAHRVGLRFGVPVTRGTAEPAAPVQRLLVGRERELQTLLTAWDNALDGRSGLLFITGDAGMGKTALLSALQQQLAERNPQSAWARGQCLAHTGTSEPYLPVLEALGHLLRKAPDDGPVELMRRVAPSWLLQLPDLMDAAEYDALKRQTAGVAKERMLREMADALEQLSLAQGLLLVIEDLHWADSATLDLISFLAQREGNSRLLVLVSLRPVDAIVSAHPVRRLQLALKARSQARELALPPLTLEAVTRYLGTRLALPEHGAELAAQVHERSSGSPLFMVQITDYLQQHPNEIDTRSAQLHEVIPEALQDLISLQLDDLAPEYRHLLEAASVLGVEFSAAATAAGTGLSLDIVEQQLELMAAHPRFIEPNGLAIWPDGTTSGIYRFRHALYPQVLRRKLLDSRRARIHRLVAERAEAAYGARSQEIAGELALHFEQGGLRARALHYRVHTARKALERVAYEPARQEIDHGLKLLDAVNEGPERDHAELALQVLAAFGKQGEHGYTSPQGNPHFDRIIPLVERCTDPKLMEIALYCLWVRRHFQCRFDEALRYADRLHQLGSRLNNPVLQASGDTFSGVSLHLYGRFADANHRIERAHLMLGSLDSTHFHQLLDLRAAALSGRALLQWMLGYPDQALRTAQEARAVTEAGSNPYSRCMSRVTSLNSILTYRHEWAQLLVESAESLKLGERYNHRDAVNWARRQHAIAMAMTGQAEEGLPLLWKTLETLRAQGSLLGLTMDYTLGAECCVARGDYSQARWALDAAWSVIHSNHTVAFESETRRMEGELALAQARKAKRANDALALTHFEQALHLAQSRQAPVLQLRAAMSLARFWQRHGDAPKALQHLKPLYESFSEGHESPDLRQARNLITHLT